jgi:hypothetical protein
MIPCSFDEANGQLGPPDGLTEDEVGTIRVYHGQNEAGNKFVVSCWRVTPAEIQEIARTGRIWLITMSGMMPTILQARKPVMSQTRS